VLLLHTIASNMWSALPIELIETILSFVVALESTLHRDRFYRPVAACTLPSNLFHRESDSYNWKAHMFLDRDGTLYVRDKQQFIRITFSANALPPSRDHIPIPMTHGSDCVSRLPSRPAANRCRIM